MQLSPYLSFNGTCEEAFKFYETCLGGTVGVLMHYEGSPMEAEIPAEWKDKVMHAEFKLGDRVFMGADCVPGKFEEAKGTSLMVGIDDPERAEKVFAALADRGEVQMPIQETFWAAKFGMLVDRYGIPWMINCDRPN